MNSNFVETMTDVKHYVNLRYTMCWFYIHIPCKMLSTVKLVDTSITLVTIEFSATTVYGFRVLYNDHIVFCVWLLSFSILLLRVLGFPCIASLFFYCWVVLHCKDTHSLFSYSLVDGRFQILFLAFVNKAAIKIHGHVSVEHVFISLRVIPKSVC